MLGSTTFAGSARHRAFLDAIGRHHLSHRRAEPEFALGVDAFGRSLDDFDPQIDNIVRVEARRLRERLRQYDDTEGRDDPVVVDVPRGGYGVNFERRPAVGPTSAALPDQGRGAAATIPAGPAAPPVDVASGGGHRSPTC